jgi:hypothetical protein
MKYNTLEISTAGMAHKVLDRLGRLRREQPEVHVTHGGVDGGRGRERGGTEFALGGSGGCNGLFFAGGTFVEDVSVV